MPRPPGKGCLPQEKINIRFPRAERREMWKFATAEGMTESEFIRDAIRRRLKALARREAQS